MKKKKTVSRSNSTAGKLKDSRIEDFWNRRSVSEARLQTSTEAGKGKDRESPEDMESKRKIKEVDAEKEEAKEETKRELDPEEQEMEVRLKALEAKLNKLKKLDKLDASLENAQ